MTARERRAARLDADRPPASHAGQPRLPAGEISQRWNELLYDRFVAAGFPEVRPAYGSLLIPLYEEDGLRQGELARRARLSKQTMTTMARALERDGLVERRVDQSDARNTDLPHRARARVSTGSRAGAEGSGGARRCGGGCARERNAQDLAATDRGPRSAHTGRVTRAHYARLLRGHRTSRRRALAGLPQPQRAGDTSREYVRTPGRSCGSAVPAASGPARPSRTGAGDTHEVRVTPALRTSCGAAAGAGGCGPCRMWAVGAVGR